MPDKWDIASYDRDNKLVLAVEVKSKRNASPEWAAQLRRNILAHGTFPNAPYFLIAYPDRFYLWKNTPSNLESTPPTYSVDPGEIFKSYLKKSDIKIEELGAESLKLIVGSWLHIIMHTPAEQLDISQHWLIDTDLHAAVLGGHLNHEVSA